MNERRAAPVRLVGPNRIALVALYLLFLATVLRTLAADYVGDWLPLYMILEGLFGVLFALLTWHPGLPRWVLHGYFVVQSVLVIVVTSLPPGTDFTSVLFVLLCYQAALVFRGRERWFWSVTLIGLAGGVLVFWLGVLRGLAQGLTNMAGGVGVVAYLIVQQELEITRRRSQEVLVELEEAHRQLQDYTAQVEELSAIEERNRLARELHDSVSQTMFSIALNTRATQVMLERKPERVKGQLEQLQALTQSALAEMRSLIARLRPG